MVKKLIFYIVYKITNQINGKIYIGAHKTTNIDDGYMGSGTYLKRAIQKHGIENFKKEILFVLDSEDAMYLNEAEIVNDEFLVKENTYNLKRGGWGGGGQINKDAYAKAGRAGATKLKEKIAADPSFKDAYRKALLSGVAKFLSKTPNGAFFGKSHKEETKHRIGKATSIAQSGSGNSQYGTRWIYSPTEKISKRIQKDQPLPDGWFEGRKIKFE